MMTATIKPDSKSNQSVKIAFTFNHAMVDASVRPHRRTRCDLFKVLDTMDEHGKPKLQLISAGIAHCGIFSKDSFNKEKGRKLALARALKMAGLTRDERLRVWEAYFSRIPEELETFQKSLEG